MGFGDTACAIERFGLADLSFSLVYGGIGLALGDVGNLLEEHLRRVVRLEVHERITCIKELFGRIVAGGSEHLLVLLHGLSLASHAHESLGEERNGVLGLLGFREVLGETRKRILGLRCVAHGGIDRAEHNKRLRRVLALRSGLHVGLVALRRLLQERIHVHLADRLLETLPGIALKEICLFTHRGELLLVGGRHKRRLDAACGVLHKGAEVLHSGKDGNRGLLVDFGLCSLHRVRSCRLVKGESAVSFENRKRKTRIYAIHHHLRSVKILFQILDLSIDIPLLAVTCGHHLESLHTVGGVGVLVENRGEVVNRLIVVLGLVRGTAERHGHLRGLIVRRIEGEVRIVQLLALGAAAVEHLATRKAKHVVTGRTRPLLVDSGEAFRKIALDRIDIATQGSLLLRVAFGLPHLKCTLSELEHGIKRVLRLRIQREHLVVSLDRILPTGLAVGRVRRLELHLADVVDLRGGDVGLDVLIEHRLDKLLDLLRQFAGGSRPAGLRILHKHVNGMVERTGSIALGTLFHTEEQIRDLSLVGLASVKLLLNLLPEHLRKQVAASRHRRLTDQPLRAVWVKLKELLVDVLQLGKVLVDKFLRTCDVALRHLGMRLERDGATIHEKEIAHPKHAVGTGGRLLEIGGLLLCILRVGGELKAQLRLLRGEHRPHIVLKRELEKSVIDGNRLVELLLGTENLYPRIGGLLIETHQLLGGNRHTLEELPVQLAAFRKLLAGIVGVGHRNRERPVFGRAFLLLRKDGLNLVEMPAKQMPLLLKHFKTGGKHRPLLTGLGDDRSREIRHIGIDQGCDERTFGIHRLLLGGGNRLQCRLVVIRLRSSRSGGLRGCETSERERRERKNWKSGKSHGAHYTIKPFYAQVAFFTYSLSR